MKAFDFFCGAGGLTRGLRDAGIEVVAGIDSDDRCRSAYQHNNPCTLFLHSDIKAVDQNSLGLEGPSWISEEILFAGCAPCQPFSQHRKGSRKGRDATLLREFGRLVEDLLPDYVLIENVPGIARVPGFSTFRRFLHMLDTHGYQYSYDVLDAKSYGVPQNRRRLVLLANKDRKPSLPEPTHGGQFCPVRTVREAIAHFPAIGPGEHHPEILNHVAASMIELNQERLRATPHDGGDRRSWPVRLRLDCHTGHDKGHTDVYGRMSWDSPAPALTGRCHSISNGRYGHPEQDRAISLREAASLQSFPDDYRFFGSSKAIAMQIGNAVPVRLAEQLGRHILRLSNGQHDDAPCPATHDRQP